MSGRTEREGWLLVFMSGESAFAGATIFESREEAEGYARLHVVNAIGQEARGYDEVKVVRISY